MSLQSLKDLCDDIDFRAHVAMGLTTPDLRARYKFWRAMGNASPSCKRWGYHPNVEHFNCDPAPWFA